METCSYTNFTAHNIGLLTEAQTYEKKLIIKALNYENVYIHPTLESNNVKNNGMLTSNDVNVDVEYNASAYSSKG